MTRSWLSFVAGLLVLVSPLRQAWAQPQYGPWSLFVVTAALLVLAVLVSRASE
jgi:hypothetical protein